MDGRMDGRSVSLCNVSDTAPLPVGNLEEGTEAHLTGPSSCSVFLWAMFQLQKEEKHFKSAAPLCFSDAARFGRGSWPLW